jgi:hypothetical protein
METARSDEARAGNGPVRGGALYSNDCPKKEDAKSVHLSAFLPLFGTKMTHLSRRRSKRGLSTLGFRPCVTGAGTDQLAGGVLLDRVRNPADRPAQGEQD